MQYDKENTVIKIAVVIKSNKEVVYRLLRNMESFPEFIRDIKSIKVNKRIGNESITEWHINVDGANIAWVERDIFRDRDMRVDFKMLSGDYDRFEGAWDLKDDPKGVRLELVAKIDWGAPVLVKFVKPVIEKKAKRSFRTFLSAIKKEAEKQK